MKTSRRLVAAAIGAIACGATALALPMGAQAAPITYEFYLVTSGSLGNWNFDNALVHFVTQSDTTQAQHFDSLLGQSDIWVNAYGTTTVTVTSQGRSVKARFNDGQLFVSIDRAGGGVGLGSFDASNNYVPTYPVGIQDGIPDCIIGDGDCVTPSAATKALPTDLLSSSMMSGRAWSDSCFPASACDGGPLQTNLGAFALKRPLLVAYDNDPMVTGIYRATLHGGD